MINKIRQKLGLTEAQYYYAIGKIVCCTVRYAFLTFIIFLIILGAISLFF